MLKDAIPQENLTHIFINMRNVKKMPQNDKNHIKNHIEKFPEFYKKTKHLGRFR